MTPPEAAEAVRIINQAAGEAGREVDQDHFGLSMSVAFGELPSTAAAAITARRPDADPRALVADSWAGARRLISAYVDAGLSKFVIRQASPVMPADEFVAGFASELMPLQT